MNPPSFEDPFQGDRLNVASNFRPEWDVPSIGREISASLNRDIEAIRKHTEPDPNQKIHLLIGPSGYGKTHLFGRIRHEQGANILFVFVDHSGDDKRWLTDVRWSIVETLFQTDSDGVTALGRSLARLLQPSLEAYFDQLPSPLQAKHSTLRKRLQDDWKAVLEIVQAVTEIAPYHALADSMQRRFPSLPGSVIRALVLGLSPVTDEVRSWLRGEELQPDRTAALRLDPEPPPAVEVLRTVAVLHQRLRTPILLCLDQVEALLIKDGAALKQLTTNAMDWLHRVPNLIMVMSCMKESWKDVLDVSFASFEDRTRSHELLPLEVDQALDLIRRRVRVWDEYQPQKGDGWPFDLSSAEQLVRGLPTSPRSFVQLCRERFDEWLSRRTSNSVFCEELVQLKPIVIFDEIAQFRRAWTEKLEEIQAAAKAAIDYQEADLWEGVREAIEVARQGHLLPEGVTLARVQDQALRPTPADSRPSAELQLSAYAEQRSVVAAVSKKDAGVGFGSYVAALDQALGGNVVGAVVVRPKAQLGVGPNAASLTRYRALINSGKVREFPLDENESTFILIECLRRLIKQAEAKDLVVLGKTLTAEDCRRLTVKAELLGNLKLFQLLFENWPELEATRAAAGVKTPEREVFIASATPRTPAPSDGNEVNSGFTLVDPASRTSDSAGAKSREVGSDTGNPGSAWAKSMLDQVVAKLRNWGQPVTPRGVEVGPSFVRLMVVPRDQTDFSKVRTKADNLKLQLGLERRPIIDAQAGYISIDVQRPDRQAVPLLPLFARRPERLAGQPAFPIGVDVSGRTHWLNLTDPSSCHLLVSGTTGSGKSEFMKAVLAALAHTLGPHELQFVLIDPKQVTFNLSGGSPYLRHPVAYDVNDALPRIEECVDEMERRYTLLRQRQRENISELTGADAVPRWVLIFDEFADLMAEKASKKELEALLKRLGAKARAAGIHLILGTQRAEATVVTPLLRSNLPGRISLEVISERDSKLILDAPDAAYLLGKGDLLWRQGGGLTRLQCPLVSREELATRLRCH